MTDFIEYITSIIDIGSVVSCHELLSRLQFLYGRSSGVASSKVGKKVFYKLQLQKVPNDGRVLHRLRNNGEELSKQIHQSIKLQNHPYHSPPHHYQKNATKEAYDATDSIAPREESKGSRWSDRHGESDQKQNIPECQEGGIKKEDAPQKQQSDTLFV